MDVAALRAEFPVLERVAYLNAGTDGPVPRRAAEAVRRETERETDEGRIPERHFARAEVLRNELRTRLAGLLGCDADEVALTRSTTDGISTVLSALELGPGDEVLTSDEEHPGLLAPLAVTWRRRGFGVRVAPFAELPGEIGPATKLVACSHVSWVGGRVADTAALAASDAQVLLDGAQGLGAVPLDVRALGCEFYAASGQKWLCGPDGSGCLYVRRDVADELLPPWPSFVSLADPQRAPELPVHPGARRFDLGVAAPMLSAWSLAALDVLGASGWDDILARGPDLAGTLAERLAERGGDVAPRGRTTLVSWGSDDAAGDVRRLAESGIVLRFLPGRDLVRASVGAWSTEDELERVVAAAVG